ncbi:hypothetical protein GVAV_002904 [Gurleya vavrai]
MAESSSEEIVFKKRRTTKTKDTELENLFEDSTASHTSIEDVDYNYPQETYSVLSEIFGTGDEYQYIYEKKKIEKKKEILEEKLVYNYQNDDILYFLARRTNLSDDEKNDIKRLLSGESEFLLFFHNECSLKLHQFFEMKERLKEFHKLKGIYKKFAENEFEAELIEKYVTTNKFENKFILTVEEFYENYINKQKIHEPKKFELSEDIFNHCNYFAKHPLFIKMVSDFLYKFIYKKNNKNMLSITQILDIYKNNNTCDIKNFLQTIEMSENDFDTFFANNFILNDEFDFIRKDFLQKSISKIKNLFKLILVQHDKKEKSLIKKNLINAVVDRILNGGRPLKEDETSFGLFECEGIYYCSVIDYRGKNIDYFSFKNLELLRNKIEEFIPQYIAFSANSVMIKSTSKKLAGLIDECPFLIVENEIINLLYDIKEPKEYSTGIAKRLNCPELEYCKLLDKNIILNFVKDQNKLNRKDQILSIERGIKISLCFVGVDVNLLRYSEYKYFFKLIGVDEEFDERIKECDFIKNLNYLSTNEILFNDFNKENTYSITEKLNENENVCVFLRIYNKSQKTDEHIDTESFFTREYQKVNIFDSLMIHPCNYKFACAVCMVSIDCDNTMGDNLHLLKDIIEDFDRLNNLDLELLGTNNSKILKNVKMYLTMTKRKEFEGATDEIIFDEIYGKIDIEKIYEGRICKVSNKYIIAEIKIKKDKGLSVFVFIDHGEFYMNQIVKIKLVSPNYSNLSYSGTLEEEIVERKLKFTELKLCKNFDSLKSQKYLIENDKLIVLRKSSQSDEAVLTLKIYLHKLGKNEFDFNGKLREIKDQDVIFKHFKLVEENDTYLFKNICYESIDEFISNYIKPFIRNLQNVRRNLKYFCTAEESENYIYNSQKNKIVYSFFLCREYPGKAVFLFKDSDLKKELLHIGQKIIYNGKEFKNIDEFLYYKKKMK